jgi:hypothetical protein
METMLPTRVILIAVTLFSLAGAPAEAQNCLGRPDFDACMASQLAVAQNQNAAAQQQLWQNYLKTNGPWLKQQYSHYRGPMTFEQFAYWNLMTANGTNIAGGMKAQQDQFQGMQRAHATVQEGNSDYRQGMYDNSARTSQAAENYNQGAIRGNTAQIDPYTGQKHWLPYAQPNNQPFSYGGQTYLQNENGYFVWNGSGWAPMRPGR